MRYLENAYLGLGMLRKLPGNVTSHVRQTGVQTVFQAEKKSYKSPKAKDMIGNWIDFNLS